MGATQERNRIAKRVKQLRLEANLDIIGLAYKSGVNPRTIERIEAAGVDARRGTLVMLASALSVDASEFGVRVPEAA